MAERIPVGVERLFDFVTAVFSKIGLTETDARITADVLLAADKRGIESHGVARLQRYVDHIEQGVIRLDAKAETVKETAVSLVIDGHGGMGQVVSYNTMKRCIAKARESGLCLASIRNSNHYGIAGYYTLMALAEDRIGISLTNTAPLVVPTFAKDALIGTNALSFGVPAGKERPFLLDMATSTVPRGKLEVFARKETAIPDCWATDETGAPSQEAAHVLNNLKQRRGGGLLPLGGARELTGGHKGYGLAVLVDILCGVLSQGAVANETYAHAEHPARVAHFLGVIDPDLFAGRAVVAQKMEQYIRLLHAAQLADGCERVYVAGEKEYEAAERNKTRLTLQAKVFHTINAIGKKYGLEIPADSA